VGGCWVLLEPGGWGTEVVQVAADALGAGAVAWVGSRAGVVQAVPGCSPQRSAWQSKMRIRLLEAVVCDGSYSKCLQATLHRALWDDGRSAASMPPWQIVSPSHCMLAGLNGRTKGQGQQSEPRTCIRRPL
jgi:hypothetical protein